MAVNPMRPYYDPGHALTYRTPSPVKGKRLVTIAGARDGEEMVAGYPAAGGAVIGVTHHDSDMGRVGVTRVETAILPVTVGETAVAAGLVSVDAEGRLKPVEAGDAVAGYALDAGAPGVDVPLDRSLRA